MEEVILCCVPMEHYLIKITWSVIGGSMWNVMDEMKKWKLRLKKQTIELRYDILTVGCVYNLALQVKLITFPQVLRKRLIIKHDPNRIMNQRRCNYA